jgi:hypothetical protein
MGAGRCYGQACQLSRWSKRNNWRAYTQDVAGIQFFAEFTLERSEGLRMTDPRGRCATTA